MNKIPRRSFLKTVGLAGAACCGGCLAGPRPKGRVIGANDAIRVGIVGLGGKGSAHLTQLLAMKNVRVTALCDADSGVLHRRQGDAEKADTKPEIFADLREMLERAPLDAIVIATPNHQHALQAIWGCQAGKDVYVEKPVCHNLFEGRQLQHVAARYDRIVQAGTQNRSDVGLIPAFDYIRKGHLGRIKMVRGMCYRLRPSIGKVDGPQPIPPEVNYDLWCGPAPMEPLMRKNLHYDWHWVWPTGDGDIGNQGPHELDLIRWVLGEAGLPARVLSIGGRLGYEDDGRTPNTQLVLFDYKTAPVLFEVRGLPMKKGMQAEDHYRGIRVGVVVDCENGYFAGGRGGGWIYDPNGKKVKQFAGDSGEGHMANFFAAMRSRRTADLRAPVAGGAVSAGLAHLANLSHRVGAAAAPAEIAERIRENKPAAEALERIVAHLAINGVDLAKTPLTLGAWLEWSDAQQRFTGGVNAEQANALISRPYRAPFVVPEIA